MSPPPTHSYNTIICPEDNYYHGQFDDLEADTSLQSGAGLDARTQGPQSSSKPPSNYVPFLERLRRLPEVRASIPWRPGQELPPEKAVDSPRVQQRGAILLSTRGTVMTNPCGHCAGGYGRFSVCVTLQNWFQGACSGCIFTSKGNKCSLRTQTSGSADGRLLRYHADDPESYSRNVAEQADKPSKKRKRSSVPGLAQPVAQPAPYTSIYPQLEPPQSASPDLDMLLQAEIAREQSGEPDSPVRVDLQPSQHPSQPNVARPRGPSKGTVAPSPYQLYAENHRSKADTLLPRDAAPMSQTGNETSTPLPATWQSRSSKTQVTPMSVIDSLPKAKQRELYGIISQCQGGIDHLQRQLESLKSLLGIDDDNSSR
ncbi:hypothetical protein BKA65DRAFT_151257 [Rhexocercosporidium sp. MPI-PUGE-AT-0058]|nr:hypothetical protein BKA65DRAFT_151257 [Rhexocercosporidium sp. MPI-PUGE-AT-0058]